MNPVRILYPMLALAGWTGIVLLLMAQARIRAAARDRITPEDFRFGESGRVPAAVSLPNRNYMNLLEAPVLFYVVCLLLFVVGGVGRAAPALAWAYVGLRVVHSLIHLGYNNVLHRLAAFALSNAVLLALWVLAGLRIAQIDQG